MLKRLQTIGVALILMVAWCETSTADYMQNYSAWRRLNLVQQQAYGMGLVDGLTTVDEGDESEAYALGLVTCILELKLTSGMVAEAISTHYAQNTESWSLPPSTIFARAIVKGPCLNHINAARKSRGLKPWEKG